MSRLDIRLNSDNYIRVSNVRLNSDGSVPTISTASAELRDTSGGSAITNSAISLSQVSGKDDEYEGTFPSSVSLTAGNEIWVWVQLVDSNGNQTEFEDSTTVKRN